MGKKYVITFLLLFLCTALQAQEKTYMEVKLGTLVIDWEPFDGRGYGTHIGLGHTLTNRISLIGNFSLGQASTFPNDVGESEAMFFDPELGIYRSDNGFNLPHRLHEHILSLSPFQALETNYHTSNYASIALGIQYDLVKRKKLELGFGILGLRQYANELHFEVYHVWYTQGVITDYAYDVSLYQLKSWGLQISNSVVWNIRPKIALTSNIDWNTFRPIKVGVYTNSLTLFSLGVRYRL